MERDDKKSWFTIQRVKTFHDEVEVVEGIKLERDDQVIIEDIEKCVIERPKKGATEVNTLKCVTSSRLIKNVTTLLTSTLRARSVFSRGFNDTC